MGGGAQTMAWRLDGGFRRTGRFMVIWLRRWAWGVGALALLWLILWLGLPALLKWQLPLRASEALGRQVTIGDVSFHPWSLDLALDGLVIAGPSAGAEPLLKVARLHANLSAASLFRFAPVIEALEVDGLRLRVARTGDGHYDVDDLIARFTPGKDAKAAPEPARFALYNVQLRDAQLRFDDRPAEPRPPDRGLAADAAVPLEPAGAGRGQGRAAARVQAQRHAVRQRCAGHAVRADQDRRPEAGDDRVSISCPTSATCLPRCRCA